ncbi:hypothetical protein H6P81_005702 [Aristolochia fimbriata]|uniref:Aromatic-L-amino-acid decarboxylase n=1 Tax=Aristolochia fimbriata TaxID=158543 RepID=A0AAV7EVD3_ARIFI|nr:hypothetical protein H6P81_005702 [Aristolochia fimbriata]
MGSLEASVAEDQKAMGAAEFKPLDPEEFRKEAHRAVDFIADYYQNVESLPVLSRVEPGFLLNRLPQTAPSNPQPLDDILEDVRKELFPGMTHWASPNFFAYFPATFSTAAFVGDMLATSFNSVGFNWLASPAATELEMRVTDWMAKLLKLPASFTFSGKGGGVIQTTTSEAILCTLVTARDRALEQLGPGNDALDVREGVQDSGHPAREHPGRRDGGGGEVRPLPETPPRVHGGRRRRGSGARLRLRDGGDDVNDGGRPGRSSRPGGQGVRSLGPRRRGVRRQRLHLPGVPAVPGRGGAGGLDEHESSQMVLVVFGLLLSVGQRPGPAGPRFEHRPGVFKEQTEREPEGDRLQGLADRGGTAVPCPPALARVPELRGGQPAGPHPLRRPAGSDVRGARGGRSTVRDRGPEAVCAGLLPVGAGVGGGGAGGVEPGVGGGGERDGEGLYNTHGGGRGVRAQVRGGVHIDGGETRGGGVGADKKDGRCFSGRHTTGGGSLICLNKLRIDGRPSACLICNIDRRR